VTRLNDSLNSRSIRWNFRDVPYRRDDAVDGVVLESVRENGLVDVPATVRVFAGVLDDGSPGPELALANRVELVSDPLRIVGVGVVEHVRPGHFVRGEPSDAFDRRTHVGDHSLLVEDDQQIRRLIEQRPIQLYSVVGRSLHRCELHRPPEPMGQQRRLLDGRLGDDFGRTLVPQAVDRLVRGRIDRIDDRTRAVNGREDISIVGQDAIDRLEPVVREVGRVRNGFRECHRFVREPRRRCPDPLGRADGKGADGRHLGLLETSNHTPAEGGEGKKLASVQASSGGSLKDERIVLDQVAVVAVLDSARFSESNTPFHISHNRRFVVVRLVLERVTVLAATLDERPVTLETRAADRPRQRRHVVDPVVEHLEESVLESNPSEFRPAHIAASVVVPVPQKGSSTVSP